MNAQKNTSDICILSTFIGKPNVFMKNRPKNED